MFNISPILSAAFRRRTAADKGAADGAICAINAASIIAAFPGPAILFGAGGAIVSANGEAERLLRMLADGRAQDVRTLLSTVAASGRPAEGQIFLPSDPVTGEAQVLYYLTALGIEPPTRKTGSDMAGERRVLMLGRDGSAEYAMRNALIASRDLYRDLSRCSSDFSWQTDENGAFTFVSSKGALGYSAQALNGRRSQDLFDQSTQQQAENPFICRTPVEDVEIILRDANGEIRYCRVDALPVYDKINQWRGARGVSTDITSTKLQQQALEFMQQRELQARAIVDAANKSLDPVMAFNETATLLAHATGASHCHILGLDSKKRLRILGVSENGKDQDVAPMLARIELDIQDAQNGQDYDPIIFTQAGVAHELTFTMHAGVPNGVIWLQNPDAASAAPPKFVPPGAGQRSLAQAVAGNIGIAIAHDNQMRLLAELSRTDELTGLLNRRAFMDDVQQRHGHLYRVSRMGALLYIDLDNFKYVNDQFGHEAGDRALIEFANILSGHSRIGDLCARLGGDEFAIWLEDTDAAGAEIKARLIIDEVKHVQRLARIPSRPGVPPIGVSVGVAIADPNYPESLEQLIKRADEVMYEVKRMGKGSLIVSPGNAGARVSK